ncbi:MAG: hypothetical protein AAFS07_03980 [Pseudomonadota bacterium]
MIDQISRVLVQHRRDIGAQCRPLVAAGLVLVESGDWGLSAATFYGPQETPAAVKLHA